MISQRVFIVDSDPVAVMKLAQMLSGLGHVLAGRAFAGHEALGMVELCAPSLLLLDLDLPNLEGLSALRLLRRLCPRLPVLICSGLDPDIYAQRCMRLGAQGYLSKKDVIEMLPIAIDTLAKGRMLFPSPLNNAGVPVEGLNDRELVVLRTLARGEGPAGAASVLKISPSNVDAICRRLRKKLGLASLDELARSGLQLGLG